MGDRFDHFSDEARRVLNRAQEEALRLRHAFIGTEHLLLALAREEGGTAAQALAELGVKPARLRRAVEAVVERGNARVAGGIELTARARRAIELAVAEAQRLRHDYVGAEHLLLGLVHEREGVAAGVLQSLGVSLADARAEVRRLSAAQGDGAGQPTTWQRAGLLLLGAGVAGALTYIVRQLGRGEESWGNRERQGPAPPV